jgi:hypothetical protein
LTKPNAAANPKAARGNGSMVDQLANRTKRKANAIPGNVDHVNYGYDRGRGGGKEPNPAKRKTNARVFGQDLMRGEHVVGERKRTETASLKGDLTFGTTMHPYDGQTSGEVGVTGTSIFDPVLCELAYRWFCPPGGLVLDPFAGGSVRGIVAAKCGRRYIGIDLSERQVAANRAQAEAICGAGEMPVWEVGDAAIDFDLHCAADFVFSCPPYGDLEVYSDNPADLSTMLHEAFMAAYRKIIAAAIDKLKEDRFACFVVGDYRDKRGFYCNFVGDTVDRFNDAGARLYNEMILVTAAGSLPIRAGKQFTSSRKVGKTHQNVLVFCKGDPRKATDACGPVEIDESLFETFGEEL